MISDKKVLLIKDKENNIAWRLMAMWPITMLTNSSLCGIIATFWRGALSVEALSQLLPSYASSPCRQRLPSFLRLGCILLSLILYLYFFLSVLRVFSQSGASVGVSSRDPNFIL